MGLSSGDPATWETPLLRAQGCCREPHSREASLGAPSMPITPACSQAPADHVQGTAGGGECPRGGPAGGQGGPLRGRQPAGPTAPSAGRDVHAGKGCTRALASAWAPGQQAGSLVQKAVCAVQWFKHPVSGFVGAEVPPRPSKSRDVGSLGCHSSLPREEHQRAALRPASGCVPSL